MSKDGKDQGPFTFDELTDQVRKGHFAPSDLSWHQGVSNWMPLEQLPEWPTVQERLDQAKAKKEEEAKKRPAPPPPPGGGNATASQRPALLTEDQAMPPATAQPAVAQAPAPAPAPVAQAPQITVQTGGPVNSGGAGGKIVMFMVILAMLAGFGVLGYVVYLKWDQIVGG